MLFNFHDMPMCHIEKTLACTKQRDLPALTFFLPLSSLSLGAEIVLEMQQLGMNTPQCCPLDIFQLWI